MIGISAQLSVYPLRQAQLSPTIRDTVRICRAHALDVRPGSMSTVLSGDDESIFAALKEVLREAAARGDVVMVITLSNACPEHTRADEQLADESGS